MKLTINDVRNFPQLKKMTLIAGEGGLNREVTHCGILDYEYDKDLSHKYYEYNYQMSDFLTLTSFLYAKNDPNLIYDAVKKLISKNGSGLIIKNIYRLPISENVIRYADHNNFPIFILNDSYPFFEDIIVMINKAMERYGSLYYLGHKVDSVLSGDMNESEFAQAMFEINPSMEEPVAAACFTARDRFTAEDYIKVETRMYDMAVIRPEDCMFFYENGFILLHSGHSLTNGPIEECIAPYLLAADPSSGIASSGHMAHSGDVASSGGDLFTVGVSGIHHIRSELAEAIRESLYACSFADEKKGTFSLFDDLGIYQALLPFAESQPMTAYMNRFIYPLEIYDSDKNSHLLNTVTQFVNEGGSLEQTAAKMGQHKNTIRYRLNRAGQILGIDPLSLGDYEQLALAVRIYICSEH